MKNKATLLVLLLFWTSMAKAQDAKGMAVYIYNFIRFIEWPVSTQTGSFIIGVAGESPVYTELEKIISTKQVNNQPVVLKKFSDPRYITRCHVIFVPEKYSDMITAILASSKNSHTLVICEKSGMINKGSAISFITKNSKLLFELNKENIKNSGLYLNNQLEYLATNVGR